MTMIAAVVGGTMLRAQAADVQAADVQVADAQATPGAAATADTNASTTTRADATSTSSIGAASTTPTDPARVLPTIKVTSNAAADPQNPQGPGVGYVATRTKTATKTDSDLLTNPQSVSIVTRQQMDDLGAQTVDQALRYTVGVNTQDGTDVRFDQIYGRGFPLDSYLDGLHLYQSPRFATPRIDPYFLDRMEVLHGPASVLYGQGSPGGLVNYVSKLPLAVPYHEVVMQIGNHNNYQLGFDFSGPVDKDGTVLYRVTGLGRTSDTQVGDIQDQRIAIQPSVTIRPDRNTTFTLQGSFQRDPNGGLFNPVPSSGTLFHNPNGKFSPDQYLGDPNRDGMHRTQYWFGYQFDHAFNDVFSVSQNVRYLHIDENYYQTSVNGPAFLPDQATMPMWANVDHEHFSQFEVDTHGQAKFATGPVEHTVLLGLDYQRDILGDSTGGGVVGNVNLFNPDFSALPTIPASTRLDYALSTVGVYAQDQMRLLKHWVLTLGMREDWVGTNLTQRSPTLASGSHANDHAFTYRAALAYEFDSGIAPYVSYAKSFQPLTGLAFGNVPFAPTRGKQVEVGVRYQPKGFDGFFSLAAYNLTQENVTVPDPAHPGFSVQTGEVRSRGIEAEAHANVTESLKLIASYAYVDQNITSSTIPATLGNRQPITPRTTASAWADYTLHRGPLRNLGFGAGVRYVSESAGDVFNSFEVPARVLVDVGAHYDIEKWRLALNVNNLFNREYISYCTASVICYWGATRTVLGTARYQW
jgi:iron complex outermembrane receptor protein